MKCSEETKRKISLAQKGKPRPWQHGRKITWADKIVATRRKNNSYLISEETRAKMRASGRIRKMPPMTDEHKKKLRESNKKTWSSIELRKRHGVIVKEVWSKMSPVAKSRWLKRVAKASRCLKKRKLSRETMLKLRRDPEWIRKSNEGKKGRPCWFKGKHHTIKTRIKISLVKKKSPLTKRGPDNPAWIDGKGYERRDERTTFQQTLEYRLFREGVFRRDDWTCQLCKKKGCQLCVDHIKSYKSHPDLRTNVENGRTLCTECHRKTPNYGRKEEYAKTIPTSN